MDGFINTLPQPQFCGQTEVRFYFSWLSLSGMVLPDPSPLTAIEKAGYSGVEWVDPISFKQVEQAQTLGLGATANGRVNRPEDAERLARSARSHGIECMTLHVGWGLEDDDEASRLIEAILEAETRHSIPLYPEIHRATIFQDPWRTVQFVKKFPELRLNGDFSHWYTGSELVYGDFKEKLAFLAPAIERVRYLHGRIGNPGAMQVDIGEGEPGDQPFVAHFCELWIASFGACLARGESWPVYFVPELLSSDLFYARKVAGREDSDRWKQSLLLVRLAKQCYNAARCNLVRSARTIN